MVFFDDTPCALAHWKDLVTVGLKSGDIIMVDAITGIHMSILSSHTLGVKSLAFSSDGTFLVSGSFDKTVNLWDIQTGGVIKTLHGHTDQVLSVSISQNCTMIASGSADKTIRLWDVQTGECHCIIDGHNDWVTSVCFSPTNSQLLISASLDNTILQWDIDGHQTGSTHEGYKVAFSPDGTHFVSWVEGPIATVWDSHSGEVVVKLQSLNDNFQHCCFSPDGNFVAGAAKQAIYTWDITSQAPHLIETFVGHTAHITSLTFSSSLISSSLDQSIRFWQVSASPTDPVITDSESTLTSDVIVSVSLQATDGIAISSDADGAVKTWDVLTGLCKASIWIPAQGHYWADTQLIEGRLVFVWLKDGKIHIYHMEERKPLQILDIKSTDWPKDFRISGDGSKVFLLYKESIQAWSIQAGEFMGKVTLKGELQHSSLIIEGSRVWIVLEDFQIQGWDFGFPGLIPVSLPNTLLDTPHFCFIGTKHPNTSPSRIEDIITGKKVFQLHGRYAHPWVAQWDGRYLIAGYDSGELLILDLYHMIPSRVQ